MQRGEHRSKLNLELSIKFKDQWLGLVNTPVHSRKCNLENLILLDQLSRHYIEIDELRYKAESEICSNSALFMSFCLLLTDHDMTPEQYVFMLLPLRHTNKIHLINMCIRSINIHRTGSGRDRNSISPSIYLRFLRASIKQKIRLNSMIAPVSPHDNIDVSNFIPCLDVETRDRVAKFDFNVSPGSGAGARLTKKSPLIRSMLPVSKEQLYYISISGGVDSMCLSFILAKLGYKFNLIHIVYGNRNETSYQELNFIKWWACQLKVPLYIYNINELLRCQGDRSFYEDMTRQLRFSFYARVQTHYGRGPILLGHILDDLHENLLSNIMLNRKPVKSGHRGMAPRDVQDDIEIYRPFYWSSKRDIYDFAKKYNIPFTINTTPIWSRRGRIRNELFPLIEDIYGKRAFDNLIELSKILEKT